jgi:uncharacterized protein YggE
MFQNIGVAIIAACLLSSTLAAQMGRRSVVRASGEGVVSVRPDQVRVSVGVTTEASTAQEATESNAAITTRVLDALRQLLGANADIRTLGFSVSPRTSQTGQIIGYRVSNTVLATSNDLSLGGRIIDTAVGAGATNISSISFTLRDPAPPRAQALRLATMQAKTNAESIATGLGMRVGAVLVAEEGGRITPFTETRVNIGAATPTPIEPGAVEVRATVSVEAELIS